MTVDATETVTLTPLNSSPKHRLGEWGATAICGNDITSSCLYVAALATIYGGAYAPLCLLLVGGVLYLYRWIYAEVGDALPLNGGAYNCLLNTTSKFRASMAACMTILSYMATGVIFKENRWRRTSHRIILAFFLLCVSILWITRGQLETLAGVYTISFLGVMGWFAVGNILLKVKRRQLPRRYRAGWPTVVSALAAIVLGLIGNVILNPDYVWVFLGYFLPAAGLISVMLWRTSLLKACLFVLRAALSRVPALNRKLSRVIIQRINTINEVRFVFFTRGDSRKSLNDVMLYVRDNEQTKRLRVAFVYETKMEIPPDLAEDLAFLDEVYPEINVDFVTVRGVFGPELIERLSREWRIPKNYMFIGSPAGNFPHRVAELGGVRLII